MPPEPFSSLPATTMRSKHYSTPTKNIRNRSVHNFAPIRTRRGESMSDLGKLSNPDRLKALRESGLLDSKPESDFDRLAQIAARLLDAPLAFVIVIGEDRQFLKSAVDQAGVTGRAGETHGLDRSFCKHAVAADAPLIVPDTRTHPLLKENKAVSEGVIAYAGMPLHTANGEVVGALCVMDSKPHEWSDDDVANLQAVARSVSRLIENRTNQSISVTGVGSAEDLLKQVERHLRAADGYARLVAVGESPTAREEALAQLALIQTMDELRVAFAHHGKTAAKSMPKLADATRRYLETDETRQQIDKAFGEGLAPLDELRTAVASHINATDLLRIAALDHGAAL